MGAGGLHESSSCGGVGGKGGRGEVCVIPRWSLHPHLGSVCAGPSSPPHGPGGCRWFTPIFEKSANFSGQSPFHRFLFRFCLFFDFISSLTPLELLSNQ